MLFFIKQPMKTPHRYREPASLFFIFCIIFVCSNAVSQNHRGEPGEILDGVEKGIIAGDINAFSAHLGSQVAITMSGDRSDYYSPNQAFSILKNFFGLRKTVNFSFTTRQESFRRAYGTGGGSFVRRGKKEHLQIYVMLNPIEGHWVITQIHIY
jgi:hypothetical protein